MIRFVYLLQKALLVLSLNIFYIFILFMFFVFTLYKSFVKNIFFSSNLLYYNCLFIFLIIPLTILLQKVSAKLSLYFSYKKYNRIVNNLEEINMAIFVISESFFIYLINMLSNTFLKIFFSLILMTFMRTILYYFSIYNFYFDLHKNTMSQFRNKNSSFLQYYNFLEKETLSTNVLVRINILTFLIEESSMYSKYLDIGIFTYIGESIINFNYLNCDFFLLYLIWQFYICVYIVSNNIKRY
ncbi:hypothetical protein AB837_00354 [bacterium AB1]|nr:hypothetical protein AB837_00354 [bacterium AB1]